jgi:hypothetical protein
MFGPDEPQGGNMAIFSKKQHPRKSDEHQSVIVDASLEAKSVPADEKSLTESATAGPAEPETAGAPVAALAAAEKPAADPTPGDGAHEEVEPEALVTPPVVAVENRFGIDDAIALMRTLPTESNASLVVRVVRATLGAVHVSVEEIVQDALRKETRIKENIANLEGQIVELDKQLAILRREITNQQADLKETVNVRERLHMAEQLPAVKPPPTPPSLPPTRITGSKSIVS